MDQTEPPHRALHEHDASRHVSLGERRFLPDGTTQTDDCHSREQRFENVTTRDNARVHMGDVYNNQHTHHHGAPHPHTREISLLDALAFEQMDYRSTTIAPAYPKTCDWLFSSSSYTRWRNQDLASEHNGFLWIKGNPGAGKSTIMKHAWEHSQAAYGDEKSVSFFFNARGAALGKSVEGMYRCLLHQIVGQVPHLSSKIAVADRMLYQSKGWPVAVLQALFRQDVLHLCRTTRVNCYIDALDEGQDENQVRGMVEYLHELAERAVSDGLPFYVCFASRYHPKISVTRFEELRLERHGGHDADISDYVRNKLRLVNEELKNQLSAEVERRSSGVFLWVVLVVAILNKEGDRGNQHLLMTQLQGIPDGLLQLIDDLRNRDTSDNRFTPAIQWVLYALRPLEPQVLYIAILASTGELAGEMVTGNQQLHNIETINDFIVSSSKGLLEISFGDIPSLKTSQNSLTEDSFDFLFGRSRRGFLVQFIHEVVREYFMGGNGIGLGHIERQSMSAVPNDAERQSSSFTRAAVRAGLDSQFGRRSTPSQESADESTAPNESLVDSECTDIFSPRDRGLQRAGRCGRTFRQTGLVDLGGDDVGLTERDSDLYKDAAAIAHNRFSQICQNYIRISHGQNLLSPARIPSMERLTPLPATFLEYSLEMVLRHAELASENGCRVHNLSQNFPWDGWVSYKSAEHDEWATYYNNKRHNNIESAAHAKSADHYRHIYTWLQMMAYEDHPHLIRDELSSIGSFTEYSRRGREEFNSLLNACCKGLGSALHISTLRSKNIRCVELLLDAGADVNKMYKDVGSPLHSACRRETDVALLLLGRGADVTITDDCGNSAVHFALLAKRFDIVREISERGADLNSCVGVHGNAAQTAGQLNDWMFMRALSELGVNVDAQDFSPGGPYKNPDEAVMDWSETKRPRYLW